MINKDRFKRYCAMTCDGGSERKLCLCTSPAQCLFKGTPELTAYKERRLLAKVFYPGPLLKTRRWLYKRRWNVAAALLAGGFVSLFQLTSWPRIAGMLVLLHLYAYCQSRADSQK